MKNPAAPFGAAGFAVEQDLAAVAVLGVVLLLILAVLIAVLIAVLVAVLILILVLVIHGVSSTILFCGVPLC